MVIGVSFVLTVRIRDYHFGNAAFAAADGHGMWPDL
jgi:hypothetical protein